ncbi:hypothetical protein [Methylotuvimicrobium sp. KM1]|uniref:hypothetical protein n=1 Tax=Methylotuvimicrobium sp. KM1 TaxID=3377707 RepID=UPI00384E816F
MPQQQTLSIDTASNHRFSRREKHRLTLPESIPQSIHEEMSLRKRATNLSRDSLRLSRSW